MTLHDIGVLILGPGVGVVFANLFMRRPRLKLKVGFIEASADTIEEIEALLNLRPVEEFKPKL